MTKTLILLGTARGDSNTERAVRNFFGPDEAEWIDLRRHRLAPYDYDHTVNAEDDFLAIANKMRDADRIVFATPVYWYAMSAQLKILFDRLTELLTTHKPIGKALRGKSVLLVATGSDSALPEGFEIPFQKTAEYFEMEYQGAHYLSAAALK